MRMLVINGSPRGAQGNTEVVVQAFLGGARAEGAEGQSVYLREKKILHCLGCFTCWTKTPGVCGRKDDMASLLPLVCDADVLVVATPLYFFTVSGMMKDFLDRLLPLALPFMEVEGGLTHHPSRYREAHDAPRRVVLISNSGFPEQAHFGGLKETMRLWCGSDGLNLLGTICCAGGAMLESPLRPQFEWYLEAARQAGREVVRDGRVSPETAAVLDRPLMEDSEAYARLVNEYWRSVGVKGGCPETD